MKTTNDTLPIQSIVSNIRKGTIKFDSYLQRQAGQWSTLQKSLLLDSVLRGYPVPPVYAIEVKENGQTIRSVIDGCQRLTTIEEYTRSKPKRKSKKDDKSKEAVENAPKPFKLSKNVKPIIDTEGKTENIGGLFFDDLPEDDRQTIMNANVTFIVLSDTTSADLVEIFSRLNNGMPLSKAQKSKAVMGYDLTSKIANIASGEVFKKTNMTVTQLKRDENQMVVSQALMLVDKGNDTPDFSAKQVHNFLAEYSTRIDGKTFEKLDGIFTALNTILGERRPTLTKVMLPPIVKAMEGIYTDSEKLNNFSIKLLKFLESPESNKEYMEHAKLHTTAKEHVQGRVAFFEKMAK